MASRGNSKAKNDIIEMLMEDHKRAKRAFREGEKLSEQEDREALEQLVQQTCAELQVHATLEEELFYPALREGIKQTDLIDEAEVEHASAKELIAQLEAGDAEDPKFVATFKVLGEYIKHHIKEEEGEMFAQLERSRIQWEPLLQEMLERREQLMEEHGLMEADEEEGEDEAAEQSSSSRAAKNGRGRKSQEVAEEETAE
jgi:hemerythrin-like domain-containing protein